VTPFDREDIHGLARALDDVVDLIDGRARVTGRVAVDLVFVDAMTVDATHSKTAMAERLQLSEDGAITILGILDTSTGKLTEPVEFISRGFVHDNDWIHGATRWIDDAMRTANKVKTIEGPELEELFTQSVTRWMQRKYRRSPVITSVVVDA